jgi:signal peptidase I
MFNFNIDSWPWKFAIIAAILVMREFVRAVSGMSQSRVRATHASSPRPMMSRREAAPVEEPHEATKWIIETLDSAAIAIGLVLFIIQPFVLQAFYIPSGSMEDTLQGPPPGRDSGGDRLLVSKFLYRIRAPKFQDVVVFKATPAAIRASAQSEENGEIDYIKRCIGEPGDVVTASERKVVRNGKEIVEPYTKWSSSNESYYDMKIIGGKLYSRDVASPNFPNPWKCENVEVPPEQQQAVTDAEPGPVPPGHYLVLGDHRDNSNDGHVWGFVPRENFIGKAICVFWPPTRIGVLDRMSFHPRKFEAVQPDTGSRQPMPLTP